MSLAQKWTYADYMVFVTGVSTRHLRSMADQLVALQRQHAPDPEAPAEIGVEGRDSNDWMIVDTGHTIVQLMTAEARLRYKLERKWGLAALAASSARSGDVAADEDEEAALTMLETQ